MRTGGGAGGRCNPGRLTRGSVCELLRIENIGPHGASGSEARESSSGRRRRGLLQGGNRNLAKAAACNPLVTG